MHFICTRARFECFGMPGAAASVGAAAGGSGGGGGGAAAAAAAGGNVQAEVGRNHADVEFAIWGGVSDKKRPAWKSCFQLKRKQIYTFFFPADLYKGLYCVH